MNRFSAKCLFIGLSGLIWMAGPVDAGDVMIQGMPDDNSCAALIAPFEADFTALPAILEKEVCGSPAPVLLAALGKSRRMLIKPAATINCQLTAALAKWEDQVVQPAAMRHFAQGVKQIRQWASYVCRSRNNRPGARISEHALANALDVAAFTLDDGSVVSVGAGWIAGGAEAAFLRDVHGGSCKIFGTVLGPDANALHKDHFHLDLGRGGVCE